MNWFFKAFLKALPYINIVEVWYVLVVWMTRLFHICFITVHKNVFIQHYFKIIESFSIEKYYIESF